MPGRTSCHKAGLLGLTGLTVFGLLISIHTDHKPLQSREQRGQELSGYDIRAGGLVPLEEPEALVGQMIEVYWSSYNTWFQAIVNHWDASQRMHVIEYTADRAIARLNLNDSGVRLYFGPEWLGRNVEVQATINGSSTWRAGTIIDRHPSGNYTIRFADNEQPVQIFGNLGQMFLRDPAQELDKTLTKVALSNLRSSQSPERYRLGDRIDILDKSSLRWRAATVGPYNDTDRMHTIFFNQAGGGSYSAQRRLSWEKVRMHWGAEWVNQTLGIYWPEYNEWLEAEVLKYDPHTGMHTVHFTSDDSTMQMNLGEWGEGVGVSPIYRQELVDKRLLIFNRRMRRWDAVKVIYYHDPDHEHIIMDDSGSVKKFRMLGVIHKFIDEDGTEQSPGQMLQ